MDEKMIQEITQRGRDFLKSQDTMEMERNGLEGYQTDQELKRPQPPLVKAPMTDSPIDLPRDFENLGMEDNLVQLLLKRKSSRVYTQEDMSLLQLSFLLWGTQGVKDIRGKSYATLRTVPAGGARHPFETYLLVRQVEGLVPGMYHYLPMTHQLELLSAQEDPQALLDFAEESLCGQRWAAKANVVFYWSFVPYRSEWRYGIFAHKLITTRRCATRPSSWTGKRSTWSTPRPWAPSRPRTRAKRRPSTALWRSRGCKMRPLLPLCMEGERGERCAATRGKEHG